MAVYININLPISYQIVICVDPCSEHSYRDICFPVFYKFINVTRNEFHLDFRLTSHFKTLCGLWGLYFSVNCDYTLNGCLNSLNLS